MNPEKIYLVHYTKLVDRLQNIYPVLKSTGLPLEIITEYDKEAVTNVDFFPLYSPNPYRFDKKIAPLWDSSVHKFRILNQAEISCTAKHLTAIKKLSEECKTFGLILEDDAIFNSNFAPLYSENIKNTPSDWDAIFLGTGCGMDYINQRLRNSQRIGNTNVYKMSHPATNCAEAYLLKPEMAKRIYEGAIPFQLVSDWEIAYQLYAQNAKVYWWWPSLVSQGSKNGKYVSELDHGQRK